MVNNKTSYFKWRMSRSRELDNKLVIIFNLTLLWTGHYIQYILDTRNLLPPSSSWDTGKVIWFRERISDINYVNPCFFKKNSLESSVKVSWGYKIRNHVKTTTIALSSWENGIANSPENGIRLKGASIKTFSECCVTIRNHN